MRALPLLAVSLLAMGCEKQKAPQAATEPSNTVTQPAQTEPPMPTTPMPMPNDAAELAKGSNAFAFDLYARLRTTEGNLAMSPASISSALAMTYGGAKGETAAQMKKALHFAGEPAATMTSWGAVTRSLTSQPGLKIRIANRLFGEKTYSFEPGYLDATKTAFDAPLEPTDFKTAFEPARVHINGWVEQQTQKRIKDLLPPKSLDATSRLVLVNAIYFLADWESPFKKEWTRDQAFHVSATSEKKVPTMNRTDMIRLAKVDGARVAELNYQGGKAAMWVVVPDAIDGLPAIEKNLGSASFDAWKSAFTPTNVDIALPRFEVNPRESLALAKDLQPLGIKEAFTPIKADFTTIANPPKPEERLYISQVFHKAFVKTDEKGTEAAAATAVVMAEGAGMPPKSVELKVDRPFLFFIVDTSTSLVLFMGRVTDPTGS